LIFLLPLGGLVPLAALSVPATASIALRAARRAFGGIGGDVAGATGELTRAALFITLSSMV
jgi:cobalamin synthase